MVKVTNTNPYYDDFNPDKKFYRILFKPAVAVQARELTQLQTILQNQIATMGDHIFENGTRVSGGELSLDNDVTYLKVSNVYNDTNVVLSNFMNTLIQGYNSGATAKVVHYIEAEGEDTNTLYVKNINGIDFIPGENIFAQETLYTTSIIDNEQSIGKASICGLNDGYYYFDGTFVRCTKQQIVLDKYSNTPTYKIGVSITDDIIDYNDDSSLLDPANESTNYGAHGADRLTYNVLLEKRDIEENDTIYAAKFIELMRVDNGEIISENKYTKYSELDKYLARRTYDESGNFTVDPFDVKLEESENDDNFDLYLGAGKAYIRGYEFETISSSKLTLPKARQTQKTSNYDINAQYGNYCYVKTIKGPFKPCEMEKINLLNSSNDKIGNAYLRFIYNNDTNYSFYLFDISLNDPYSFNDVSKLTNSSGSEAILEEGTTKLYGTSYNNLLFQTPHTSVKTLKSEGISDTDYITQKSFDVSFQSGSCVINVNGNNTFQGATGVISDENKRSHYLIMLNNVVNAGSTGFSNGDIIPYNKSNITLSAGNQNATIDVGDTSFSATATILASVNLNYKPEKTKSLNKITITKSFSEKIDLGYADIYKLESVLFNEQNITSDFTLDNGQRDNMYDHGSISYKGNESISGDLSITFSYFEHSGSGYLSVDSYSSINYGEIPSYTMNNGTTVSLRDVLDFRPRKANNSENFDYVLSGFDLPRPNGNINADYEFYLGRTDKIILKEDRTFDYIEGVPSLTQSTPNDRDDAMTLYIINIPAYTFKLSDLDIKYVDNKRYTMRDIGKLDDRVSKLEYLATLSSLENAAKNTVTIDENGESLFKSGILVDSFIGHNVGDLTNSDYNCSIDSNERLMRPSIESISLPLTLNTDLSHNISNNNGLITPNYTEEKFISQNVSTGEINLNPFDITSWIGNVEIRPDSSLFVDSRINPDVITNNNGINDGWNLTSENPYNIHYDYWKAYWYGDQYNNEDDVMLNTDTANNIKKVINNKVVNVDVLPYVDSLNISFKVNAMRPNTIIYPFLDSLDITQYMTVIQNGTESSSKQLITDSRGFAEGKINIPSGVIRSGTRLLRFIDRKINNLDEGGVTTLAEINFHALGLLNNRTDNIVSSIPPLIQRQEIVEDYNLITSTPTRKLTAQSFVIVNKPNGVYVDKLNLYFKSKSENLPISIELRPDVDGLPHANKVIPYSQVTLNPSNINVSNDGSLATTISFKRPIFLIDGEYSIVIHTNSSSYKLFEAVVGDTVLNSVSDSKVSKQLYVGNIFITGNSGTWESESSKMLKFDLIKMKFNSNSYAVFDCKYPENDFEYNTFYAHIHNIIQSNCTFNLSYKNRYNGGFLSNVWSSCENDKNIDMDRDFYLYNNSDSFQMRVDFNNSGESTSSIDLDKINVLFIKNVVNNSSSAETEPSGGDAKAKYITKKITLKEGFDADDLKVIFDAYKPNNTEIEVYYKVLNGEDGSLFENRPYVKMKSDDNLYSSNKNDIKEYTYYANSIQYGNYIGFKTFAIKIVIKSPNNNIIPFVKNLKVMALV